MFVQSYNAQKIRHKLRLCQLKNNDNDDKPNIDDVKPKVN